MSISPALLSVIAFVALNSILFAFYLGKVTSRVDRNSERIDDHASRLDELETRSEKTRLEDERIGWRLGLLEELKVALADVDRRLAASEATARTEREAMRGALESLQRQMQHIQRQLGNLMGAKSDTLHVLPPPDA